VAAERAFGDGDIDAAHGLSADAPQKHATLPTFNWQIEPLLADHEPFQTFDLPP
jgi:hypothetical protein